jgi:hypothetical protein
MIDSFESKEWTNKVKVFPVNGAPYETELGNIFTPKGYLFWYKHGKPVEHDPTNYDGWTQPEARYSEGFENRVYEGSQSFMFFGFYRIIDAGLMRIYPCQKGSTLKASVMVHAWSSVDDNPAKSTGITEPQWFPEGQDGLSDAQRNFTFWIGIDPLGGSDPFAESVVWGEGKHVYNEYEPINVEAKATGETFTVFIRAKSLWRYKHNDAYIDYLEVTETPETGTSDCWGKPRVDYERTVVLMPQDATEEHWLEAVTKYFDKRYTISQSADDAGIGALCTKNVIAVWVSKTSWGDLDAFFADYYDAPQCKINLTHDIWYDQDPTVPPSPPPIQQYSDNFIGLHSADSEEGWNEYIAKSKPTVVKRFSFGALAEAMDVEPKILGVFRRHVGDDGSWITQHPADEAARHLADLYQAEFEAYAKSKGVTVDYILEKYKPVLESYNETIPTYNPDHTRKAVAVDVAFSKEIHRRWGNKVSAGLLTVAVGNPHETEVVLLLPAVKQAVENGDYIAYHSYWSANRERDWLEENWLYHAGRWTEWDKVFVKNGYYPKYYLGEGGICYAHDGWTFQSSRGWKSCGDFPTYITQLLLFNDKVRAWNATHGNRCFGLTVFCYGGWGWENFTFSYGDLKLLMAALEGV